MIQRMLVNVRGTVRVLSGPRDAPGPTNFVRSFWVNTRKAKEDGLRQAFEVCRKLGWEPFLPADWHVCPVIAEGSKFYKDEQGHIIPVDANQ